MALFGLFGNKKKGFASPWLQLTVVYVATRQDLTADQAYLLRGKVLSAGSIQFDFFEPASFQLFFAGNAAGLQKAQALADAMQQVARDNGIVGIGISVQQGECLAERSESGRFVARPVGPVLAQTMREATSRAEAAAAGLSGPT